MSDAPAPAALARLARAIGVLPSYLDQDGHRHHVATSTLLALVTRLGVACTSPRHATGALRELRAGQRASAPEVLVAWDGAIGPDVPLEGVGVALEDGSRTVSPEGPERLPYGVHELDRRGADAPGIVISAPRRAVALGGVGATRAFGVVAPTYALVDRRGYAHGDLTGLAELGRLVTGHAGRLVGTLPLLAEFATADGAPAGQSPYAPVSRMWWNEAYLDLDRLPELDPADRRAPFAEVPGALVDLAGRASAIRPALERAEARLCARDSARRRAFRRFARAHRELDAYAGFRAAVERHGSDRSRWPEPALSSNGTAARRHAYAQWATETQLGEVASGLGRGGAGLYLDVPIGCRPDGFDPFCYPRSFVSGVSVGAPPDGFFAGGQDWGFVPTHPSGDRALGYPMLRAVLDAHMRHADAIRLDHVMGISRQWWIPSGMGAAEGAYVRYPSEEILALVCLYSHHHRTHVIGEDLGTVEAGLRRRLERGGISTMHVTLMDAPHDPARSLRPGRAQAAYVGTHDSSTFAGFVTAADVDLEQALGRSSARKARRERRTRRETVSALLAALGLVDGADIATVYALVLERLGSSGAAVVLVSLEDLSGEIEPVNVPGAGSAYPSFRRRLTRSLEDLADDPGVADALSRLAASRRPGTLRAPRREDRGQTR